MHINLWIGLKQSAFDTLRPLLDDYEYDGQHLLAVRFFRRMINHATVDRMFKVANIGGDDYRLFSLTFNDLNKNAALRLQEGLDHLTSNYPNQFAVAGAWFWDGRQVGTQWVDPEDHSQGTTGTPLYPINETQLLKFMPDVWNGDDPPTYSAATQLTDVILTQGQSHRRFT